MHGKTHKYEGMRHTYWYAAMSEDAVQRSRWTFYEVVNSRDGQELSHVPLSFTHKKWR